MRIGVLGTGSVGQAHAIKLITLGHEVMLGTQDVTAKLSDTSDSSLAAWLEENPRITLGNFADTAAFGEIVFNALRGEVAVETLKAIAGQLEDKILVDISVPLDFSEGMPPFLFTPKNESLGEQIQAALPKTQVVKTFNTMNASVQVDPQQVHHGEHHIFISGNDVSAKATVVELLHAYGWKHCIDLGGIETARGTEAMVPFWVMVASAIDTQQFNFSIVR